MRVGSEGAPSFGIVEETRSGIVTKWLAGLRDGQAAEFVLVERPEKNIVCFSTMVGCPVGCGFCASGIAGLYKRRLSAGEMLAMISESFRRASDPSRPWVVSAMGEGEPAANIDNVLTAFSKVRRDDGIKLALSTSAPSRALLVKTLEAVRRFGASDGREVKLQYSLHSAIPSERVLMFRPGHLPPAEALSLIRRSGHGKVEVNVTLIEGWNDRAQSAIAIADVLEKEGPWHVKLNRFNGIEGHSMRNADDGAYLAIQTALACEGHWVEYYETDGNDISAACGQLHFQHAEAAVPRF